MSPSRFSSFFVLLTAVACAQDAPFSVSIAADRAWLLAARTLPLTANVAGEFGEPLPGAAVNWISSNPAVARVSDSGVVTGLLPGVAVIEAAVGTISAQYIVSVHPARIEITPARLELEAGESASFTARALDADGKPLSGPAFRWTSGVTSLAAIDDGGNVRAVAAGSVTVTARLDMPQRGVGFSGQAQVVVKPRTAFRFERIASSDASSAVTIKAIHNIHYANDRFVFTASLSNGASAVLLYTSGLIRKIILSGEILDGIQVSEFWPPSINTRGDVIVGVRYVNGSYAAALFPFDKPQEPVMFREPDNTGRCCLQVTAGALADNGEFVFGTYYFGQSSPFDELYVARAGGPTVRIPTDNLPGLGRGVWMRNRAKSGGPGRVFFGVDGAGKSGVFLWDGRQVIKVIAQGDSILGRSVDWIDLDFASGPAGDVYIRFGGPNYHRVARWSAGTWTPLIEGGQQGVQNINLLLGGGNGVAVIDAATTQGRAILRVGEGQLHRITSLGQDSFLYPRQAFVRPDGDVVVHGPTVAAHARISRFTAGAEALIYESGRNAGFQASLAVNWSDLGGGPGAGAGLITRTTSGAIIRLAAGGPQLLLSPGDTVGPGEIVESLGSTASAPNGDTIVQAFTTSNQRLYLFRQQTRSELRPQLPSGEVLQFYSGRVAIDSKGQVAVIASIRTTSNGNQSNRMILFSEANPQARIAITQGAPAPGGGTYNWIEELAFDPAGRIWFSTNTTGSGSVLFLWDNGTVRRLHAVGDLLPDGRRLERIQDLQFSGGKTYFYSWFLNSPAAYFETDGSQLRFFLRDQDATSFGGRIGHFPNGDAFRFAPNGDLCFLAYISNQVETLIIRKPDGTDVIVARAGDRIGTAGPWAENILDVAWTTDNRLFFTATTLGAASRIDLFLASPK